MRDSIKKFILLVSAHFPRQKFGGDEEMEAIWMRSMADILSAYEDDTILTAAATIVRTRRPDQNGGTMFPKPVECLDACESARRTLYAKPPEATQIQRALGEHVLEPGNAEWGYWMDHFRSSGQADLAGSPL